ncbi:MAG: hypothetical protein J6Y02_06640 [Pseudobutyrivibrio sp.]|nr:hypothetical protein [Pseudobutyrivibrio sp.]
MAYFPCVGPQVEDKIVMSGNPLSFNTDDAQLAQDVTVTYNVTQSGSGDPSPSNVRPFVGQDVLTLAVPRKNLFKVNNPTVVNKVSYVISGNTIAITNTNSGNGHYAKWNMRVNEGETYTLSAKVTAKSETTLDARLRLASGGTYYDVLMTELNTTYSVTITIPSGVSTLEIFLYPQITASGAGQSATFSEIQVEKSETATAYEPYNPITDISILLGETLYVGTWNVEKGLLTITHAIVDMGSLTWSWYSSGSNMRSTTLRGSKKVGGLNVACDIYKTKADVTQPLANLEVCGSTSSGDVFVKDTNYGSSDVNAFKTAVTGHYVVYELATPIVLHLTPHVVELLNGANIVTSNGMSISLKYRKGEIAKLEDLTGLGKGINSQGDLINELTDKINDNIATNHEYTDTASKAYAVGEYFTNKDGDYCRVIMTISNGGTLTKNTNYIVTSISSELTANKLEATIDLTPYTSGSNKYTFPSDGYVVASTNAGTEGTIRVAIFDGDSATSTWLAGIYFNATVANEYRSLFVKKGMKAQVTKMTVEGGSVYYYKLKA